jgi:L,D-peptidoglycan transpeptidase YkuD (ErfK/YbiS/YcfS/YnhG family)
VITINSNAVITWHGHKTRCALGKGGLCHAADKREGDGATPMGTYTLRRLLYRADRLETPKSILPCRALRRDDGWCDDPADAAYNRPVMHPYPATHETMWREDHVYDLIGILSHNDSPPTAGLGSAIFMHLARPDYSPTRGCIALNENDLRALFSYAGVNTPIRIG